MKYSTSKILFFFIVLFFLDLLKPLGYALSVDFLFLGIVYVSLNYYFNSLIIFSLLFGYLKDIFAITPIPLNMIEYSLVSLFMYKIRTDFLFINKKNEDFPIKLIVAIFLFILHFIFNQKNIELFLSLFFVVYLIQSALIYAFLTYFFRKYLLAK
ncbi:MAG: hypothetical protein KBB01_05015 [Candidatus Omnitrophica bacterium]|jgi:hypothetical protein|nr:hypothetical protein [Candidatus Omnitrophota bacterium]